jgi:hypothetical protein
MGHGDRNTGTRSPMRGDASAAAAASSGAESAGSAGSSVRIPEPPLKMPRRDGIVIPVPPDLESSIDAIWNRKLEESCGQIFDSIKAPLEGLVKAVIVESSKVVSDRLDAVEVGHSTLAAAQSSTEQALGKLAEEFRAFKLETDTEIKRTQQAVVEAEAKMSNASFHANSNNSQGGPQPPNVTNMGGFFRAPDPTVLFANTMGGTKVSRDKFHQVFLALAVEANLDDSDFVLVGDLLDDRFEIKFAGDTRRATAACHQFYSSLRLGKGRWKTQEVVSDTNAQIKFFVSPDKNTAQTRREMLAKHLKAVIAELSGRNLQDIWIKKETGALLVDRRHLLSVSFISETEARIEWSHGKRVKLKVEQAPVELALKAFVGGPGS